jgi:putative ABC transport system substrate-binding protein
MDKKSSIRFPVSSSDNRKAKIQNLKWGGIVALVVTFTMCGAVAQAQQPKKVARIGYLSSGDPAGDSAGSEGIRLALRERGYLEGQNIATEYRYAAGKRDRVPELAAELVRLKVDIIVVAGGLRTIQAAKNATKTIPIVMTGEGSDPVKAGLIESLAHPGGNVTGLTNLARELGGKQLELLKEAVPKVAGVAVLYDLTNPANALEVKEGLSVAARALRLTIQPWEVRGTNDFDRVFAAMGKQRPDGLYVPSDPLLRANQKRIVGFTLKSRLPSTYAYREAVDAGGLMYYGRTSRTATGASPPTWTKSSRAPSLRTCRWSSRRSLSS